jgi:hypothetical protein
MSDVIKFDFNVPVELALRFTEPRVFPPSDRYPGGDDRHMFSTTDGRVMYVTPLTSARIQALQLAQGEFFYICKRKNGRFTEFVVSREPMSAAPPLAVANNGMGHKKVLPPLKSSLPSNLYYSPAVAQEPAPGPSLEEQLRASIEMVNRRKTGEQGDGTLAVMAPPAPRPAVSAPAPVRPAAESRLAPAVAEFSSRLILETNALVDVYAAALKAASERHGNAVKADDVRSLLVTAYINASKQGGRNAA